jgi:hypothetical protein
MRFWPFVVMMAVAPIYIMLITARCLVQPSPVMTFSSLRYTSVIDGDGHGHSVRCPTGNLMDASDQYEIKRVIRNSQCWEPI